jgi:hypothetical protein
MTWIFRNPGVRTSNLVTSGSCTQVAGAAATLGRATVSFVMSVCPSVRPYGTTGLPLDGHSWNLTSDYFSKICVENSSIITIGQEWRVLYMKTNIRIFLSYLAQFFLEWELFDTKVMQKIKTHFMFNSISSPENCGVREISEKRFVEPHKPQMTIKLMRIACWVPKATHTHSLTICNT